MSRIRFFRSLQASLPSGISRAGEVHFTERRNLFVIDSAGNAQQITDIIYVADLAALNAIQNPIIDKLYILRSNGGIYLWNATSSLWILLNPGGGSGEVNDGQNIGPTSLVNTIDLFAGKSGVNLQFKRIAVDDVTNTKEVLQMAEAGGLVVFTLDLSNILLEDLGDVSGTSPANGQILRWNGTEWVPSNETAAPGGGEANDGANLGAGSQVYSGKSGATLQFRSLKGDATQNGYIQVRVRTVSNDILFDVPYSAIDILQLPGIDGGNASDGRILVWNAAQEKFLFQAPPTPGETNTGANLGTGSQVYSGKSGATLQFRSLKGDATQNGYIQVRVRTVSNEILFDVPYSAIDILQLPGIDGGNASDGRILVWNAAQEKFLFQALPAAGETNTGANTGTGAAIYTGKSGAALQFRRLDTDNEKEIVILEDGQQVKFAAGNLLFRKNFGVAELTTDLTIDTAALDDETQYENPISAGLILCETTSANITITIDVAAADTIPGGWNAEFFNYGTGRVIFAAGTDCALLSAGTKLDDQHTSAHIVYIGLNSNTNKHEFALRGALSV